MSTYQSPEDTLRKQEGYNNYLPGYYKHYKGGLYKVEKAALHTETKEELVVYTHLSGTVYVRPCGMFDDMVEVGNQFKPHQMYRFRYLTGCERLRAQFQFLKAKLFA